MNQPLHAGLTVEKWRALTWDQRLLNIASELSRVKNALRDHEAQRANQAIERALELIDLTVGEAGPKGPAFLREILRFREALVGFYIDPKKSDSEFVQLFRGFLDLESSIHNLGLRF